MTERITPPPAVAKSVVNASVIADQLASASLDCARTPHVFIDRSASPPGAPGKVTLPAWVSCGSCVLAVQRPAVAIADADPVVWFDLIPPNCLATMPQTEREQLQGFASMPTARAGIDVVHGGIARIIQPGLEDVARIPCPYKRVDVMLALGWLEGTCPCIRALMASLPDDLPQAVYVKSGEIPPTRHQLADRARDEQRQRQRSQAWSAHLRAKAEERRRPPIGDLFHEFNTSDRPAALTPAHPAF